MVSELLHIASSAVSLMSDCRCRIMFLTKPIVKGGAIRGLHTIWLFYTVHCTLYTVHCTLYTVHCTLYTDRPFINDCAPTAQTQLASAFYMSVSWIKSIEPYRALTSHFHHRSLWYKTVSIQTSTNFISRYLIFKGNLHCTLFTLPTNISAIVRVKP